MAEYTNRYMPDHLELSLVIPFFNEEDCVVGVCRELDAVLSPRFGTQWELIMVDDGSTDRTPDLIDELAERFTHFRAVHIHPNSGQSAALDAGFRSARGTIIGTLDGDGQNDPNDIPQLLNAMNFSRVDMMCGIRANRSDSSIRKISSRIANRVRSAVLHDAITDIGCSLRVFHRRCLDRIYFFKNAHRFFPALVQFAGYKVSQMTVGHRPRLAGSSRYGGGIRSRLFAGLFDLVGVFWMRHRFLRYDLREYKKIETVRIGEKKIAQ